LPSAGCFDPAGPAPSVLGWPAREAALGHISAERLDPP
jgi:hypothetical protein